MTNTEETIQRLSTADFTETPRLMLEQPTGDVRVEAWDRPEIEVSTSDDDRVVALEVSGPQVVVRGRRSKHKFAFKGPELGHLSEVLGNLPHMEGKLEGIGRRIEREVARSMRHLERGLETGLDAGHWAGGGDYTIKVPHNCDLTLRTSTGDLHITGVEGVLYLKTASGDIDLNDVKGSALVQTASGDIDVDGISGRLGLRTASGDVEVHAASLEELSVQSASGDIELELQQVPDKGFEVQTVSGDVRVTLPADAKLTVEYRTFSGEVHTRLPHQMEREGRRGPSTLKINGGGATAHFSSVSGDLELRARRENGARSQGQPTTNISQASTATEGEDRTQPEGYVARQQAELEILQALERGEISAQEAMRRLSELG